MVVRLNGGVQIAALKEGTPRQEGNLRIWERFHGQAVSMRILQLDGSATLRNDRGDEVLYVLEDDVGIHLPAGAEVPLMGTLTIVGVCGPTSAGRQKPAATRVALAHLPIQHTGDRWYRELIQS